MTATTWISYVNCHFYNNTKMSRVAGNQLKFRGVKWLGHKCPVGREKKKDRNEVRKRQMIYWTSTNTLESWTKQTPKVIIRGHNRVGARFFLVLALMVPDRFPFSILDLMGFGMTCVRSVSDRSALPRQTLLHFFSSLSLSFTRNLYALSCRVFKPFKVRICQECEQKINVNTTRR